MKYIKVSSYKKSKVKFKLHATKLGYTKPRYYNAQDLQLIGSDFSKKELTEMVGNNEEIGIIIDTQSVGYIRLERTLDALDIDY